MQLAHRTRGEGGRPLVLLHGLAGTGDDFSGPAEALARVGWFVIAPDLRGHGASPKPADEAAYSVAQLADDVVELIDGLDDVTLFGHELGALVAQEVAVRHPSWLRSLVLQATCPGPL